ncbi:hypothetical protein [Bacillus subtilis]|uniref:hypothetical protein n=1 Tax=Bacillus subtilis TaxID=1423 RepID=UPI003F758E1E
MKVNSNETKQPITDKLSAIGCLKGVLIPVSKTGVSPIWQMVFFYNTATIGFLFSKSPKYFVYFALF